MVSEIWTIRSEDGSYIDEDDIASLSRIRIGKVEVTGEDGTYGLTVVGGAKIDRLTVDTNATISGATTVNTFSAVGNATFNTLANINTLTVAGPATLSGTTTANVLNVAGSINLYNPASFNTISVTNLTVSTLNATIIANGDVNGTYTPIGIMTLRLAASGVTAGTYTKTVVDTKGRVISGTSIASSDVTTALGYTPVNKAGDTIAGALVVATLGATIIASGDVTGTYAPSGTIPLALSPSGASAGTYTKVVVDTKGRVTVGSLMNNADIVASLGYTPVNKAGDAISGTLAVTGALTALAGATVTGTISTGVINSSGNATLSGTTTLNVLSVVGNATSNALHTMNTLSVVGPATLSGTTNANVISVSGTISASTAIFTTQTATDNSTKAATTAFVWSLPAQQQIADSTTTGGNARATGAVDWQSARTLALQVASGTYSVISGGQNNVSSGNASVASGGMNNTSSGNGGVVAGGENNAQVAAWGAVGGGYGNSNGGQWGTVSGGLNNAVGNGLANWCPGGSGGSGRGLAFRGFWSAGNFSTGGDSQSGELVLRRITTDATATRLTADGAAAGTTNSVNLPNNSAYLCKILIVALQTGGSAGAAGDAATWEASIQVTRGANAASTVVTNAAGWSSVAPNVSSVAGSAAWRLSITADTTNGGVAVTMTGEANKTIRWVARVSTVEVVY